MHEKNSLSQMASHLLPIITNPLLEISSVLVFNSGLLRGLLNSFDPATAEVHTIENIISKINFFISFSCVLFLIAKYRLKKVDSFHEQGTVYLLGLFNREQKKDTNLHF